jgi:hypothetical protein
MPARPPCACGLPQLTAAYKPSARQKTLDKEVFADEFFVVYSLPSAALGKAFAHSAKRLIPVVALRIFSKGFSSTHSIRGKSVKL